jgi:hypothetical protein
MPIYIFVQGTTKLSRRPMWTNAAELSDRTRSFGFLRLLRIASLRARFSKRALLFSVICD